MPADRHPSHDAVAAELRRRYREAVPELGIDVLATPYGLLSDVADDEPRLLLTIDDPSLVAGALADAVSRTAAGALAVVVDDPTRLERLAPGLDASGCVPMRTIVHLAFVGPFPDVERPPGVVRRAIDADELAEWCKVKVQCFANDEAEPPIDAVAKELRRRTRDLPLSVLHVAELDGAVVGIQGTNVGDDEVCYLLGTLPRARRLGVASALLRAFVEEGTAQGCRSLSISAREAGEPQQLYRRLGFTDVVHWCDVRSWHPDGASSPG